MHSAHCTGRVDRPPMESTPSIMRGIAIDSDGTAPILPTLPTTLSDAGDALASGEPIGGLIAAPCASRFCAYRAVASNSTVAVPRESAVAAAARRARTLQFCHVIQ